MKVIFLDMDGVMNSWQSAYWYRVMLGHEEDNWANYRVEDIDKEDEEFSEYSKELCPLACANLRDLLETYPETRIVISSTWRRGRTPDWFNRLFRMFKIIKEDRVIDKTEVLGTERGNEIREWLERNSEKHNVEEFVILDDDGDMCEYCGTDNFVQTSSKVGFDYHAKEKVDTLFGGYNLKFEDLKVGKPYYMFSRNKGSVFFKDGDGMAYFDDSNKIVKGIFFYKEYERFAVVPEDV